MPSNHPDTAAKEVLWSLQNNKRTAEESRRFRPTGKKPRKNGLRYVLLVFAGLLGFSVLLAFFVKEPVELCLAEGFCVHSAETPLRYILFVFFNLCVLVFGVYFAYRIGSYFGKKWQL
ncbi:MAG: hypothetical protein Q4G08_01510 [Capnocytophaga sp.]|nr:hypothetical protein [Capnocytophaga sp.]